MATITPKVREDYKVLIVESEKDLRKRLEHLDARIQGLSQRNAQDFRHQSTERQTATSEKESTQQQNARISSQISGEIGRLEPVIDEPQFPVGQEAKKYSIDELVSQLHSHENDINKQVEIMSSGVTLSKETAIELERLVKTRGSIRECLRIMLIGMPNSSNGTSSEEIESEAFLRGGIQDDTFTGAVKNVPQDHSGPQANPGSKKTRLPSDISSTQPDLAKLSDSKVQSISVRLREPAIYLLRSLASSARPLTTREAADAIFVSLNRESLHRVDTGDNRNLNPHEENTPRVEDVISACEGLVSLGRDGKVWFTHHLEKEYFDINSAADNNSSLGESDIESIFSANSFPSSLSSHNDASSAAVLQLAQLLLNDDQLALLCGIAISRLGVWRFERNLRWLLIYFGKSLTKEAFNELYRQAAQFVQSHATVVAAKTIELLKNGDHFGVAESSKSAQVNEWLAVLTNDHTTLQHMDVADLNNGDVGSTESEYGDSGDLQAYSLRTLDNVKDFMISAEAFTELRQSLRTWLRLDREDKGHEIHSARLDGSPSEGGMFQTPGL